MTKALNENKKINTLQVITWFLILCVPFVGTGLLFLLALTLFPGLFFAGTGPFGLLALIGVGLLGSLLALITFFMLSRLIDNSLWEPFETSLVHFFKGPFFQEKTVEWETLLHQFEAIDQRLQAKSPEMPQQQKALAAFNQGHYPEAVLLFDSLYVLSPAHKLIKAKASIHLALQKRQACPSMTLSELSAVRYLLEEIILSPSTCEVLKIEAYQYQALVGLLQEAKAGAECLSKAQALLSQQAHPSALTEERQQLIALLWTASDDPPALREKLVFKAMAYQKLAFEPPSEAYCQLQHIALCYAASLPCDPAHPDNEPKEESSNPSSVYSPSLFHTPMTLKSLKTEEGSDQASDLDSTDTMLSPYSLLAQGISDTGYESESSTSAYS